MREVFETRDRALARLSQYNLTSIMQRPRVFPAHEQEILKKAKEHFYSVSSFDGREFPDFGNRWGVFQKEMLQRIEGFPSCVEALDYAQRHANFDHRGPATPQRRHAIETARSLLRYEHPEFTDFIDIFEESIFSWPESLYWEQCKNGNLHATSEILHHHMGYLLTILSFQLSTSHVCEIGGGYGDSARIWMTNPIKEMSTYTIIDLPESLFFAEIFLSLALPDIQIHYINQPNQIIPQNKRAIILCPLQFHKTTQQASFDVIFNTGSLAEMTDAWVTFWSDWLTQQNTELFYSYNMFANPVDKLFEGRSMFAPVMPQNWEIGYIRTMPPMTLIQSEERKFTEIIFKKAKNASVTAENVEQNLSSLTNKKLSFEDYVWFSYNIHKAALSVQLKFLEKIQCDFSYTPVEVIVLLSNVIEHKDFLTLDTSTQKSLRNYLSDLQYKFETHYPKGTFSD